VVFISLVDTAERGALSLRDQELFKQRFNVAASRARDQMWIGRPALRGRRASASRS
jgi:superfamily I DNA and/or RNA helicase